MTPPTALTMRLEGYTAPETLSATTVPVFEPERVSIVRSIGLYGDELTVKVRSEDWSVTDGGGDWDLDLGIDLVFGEVGAEIRLGGYRFLRIVSRDWGVPMSGSSTAEEVMLELKFVTLPGLFNKGRSGFLIDKTYNPLGKDGFVDEAHADFRTCSELATIACDMLGITLESAAPSSMDDITPTQPADWGNAGAVHELDGLLAFCGHSIRLNNAGDEFLIFALPRPSDPFVVEPTGILDTADPFTLDSGVSLRGKYIVVTSGRTRSTIVRNRTLSTLEWVAKDERTGTWMNQTQWAAAYASEIGPADITAFRAGPDPDDKERGRQYARLYRSLRLASADLATCNRFIALSQEVEFGEGGPTIGGVAAIAFVRGAVLLGAGQFENMPPLGADDPVRIDSLSVIPEAGVFVLPPDLFYVRMNPGPNGALGDANAMGTGDIEIIFAHEANENDYLIDYYMRAFEIDELGDVTMLDDEGLAFAISQPGKTIRVEAPFLQRLLIWPDGDPDPVSENDTELDAIALELATMHVGAELNDFGVIPLRGLIGAAQPGILGGRVSRVVWDMSSGFTLLYVNEHDAAQSGLTEINERSAARSYAAGFGRFNLPGSSMATGDVRVGSAPGGGGA